MKKETLIFNGTGVNYSWHFPRMAKLDVAKLDEYESVYLISGGGVAFSVFWGKYRNLVTWTREDFLNWSRHTTRVYGNGPLKGLWHLFRLATGTGLPLISEEKYREAYAIAVKPEFFEVPLKEFPKNVYIPLHNLDTGEIELAHAQSPLQEFPAYRVLFAATAIPKVFPEIRLGKNRYGDAMYAKGFLRWLRKMESETHYFRNYNLIKSARYPNGEYHCLVPGNGKKQIARDTLKFLFGLPIAAYPENVRKSDWY